MKELILDYKKAYKLLEKCTPLRFNCGKLCNGKCCETDGENKGMLLFPHEEALIAKGKGFDIIDSNLRVYDNAVKLLVCDGECDRTVRPLACRIFPLTPLLTDNGIMQLKIDPRGRYVCPLCIEGVTAMQPVFRKTVRRALTPLLKHSEVISFLNVLTKELEEMNALYEAIMG